MESKNELTKEQKIAQFDPDAPGNENLGIYGLPFTVEESDIVLIEVPWAVTVSSGGGAEHGPRRIKEGSLQVDIFNPSNPDVWKRGIAVVEPPPEFITLAATSRSFAEKHIELFSTGNSNEKELLEKVNEACTEMVSYVELVTQKYLLQGKIVGLIGGDHSTPLGFINALCKKYKGQSIGILHIDAHFDLREAYERFIYSHASIMYNALMRPGNEMLRLTSVGVRDFCKFEYDFWKMNEYKVKAFTDKSNAYRMYSGESWKDIVKDIIATLPENVYISFDIDGLKQMYCPNTGTPVPGGLEYQEALYLLEQVCKEKTIVGFDINEVGDGEWDGFVGAKLLYEMISLIAK
jgi:agmatinase